MEVSLFLRDLFATAIYIDRKSSMKDVKKSLWLTIIIFELFACSNQTSTIPEFSDTKLPATPTIQQITMTPALLPQATDVVLCEPSPSDPSSFPLSEPGPYWTGYKRYTFTDESRADRNIKVTIWYPALQTYSQDGSPIFPGPPDLGGAPYPVIMTGNNTGNYLYNCLLYTSDAADE